MKKNISKLLLTTLMLVALLGTLVAQAYTVPTTGSITIRNTPANTGTSIAGKTFQLYQVFESDEFGNYYIASGFSSFFSSLGCSTDDAALNYVEALTTDDAMDIFVQALRTYVQSSGPAYTAAGPVAGLSGSATEEALAVNDLAHGYYFVMDPSSVNGTTGVVAAGSLVVVTDVASDVVVKISAPTVDKKVWHDDINDGNGAWDDVADNQIGETIKYRVASTVPADVSAYVNYTYILSDVMSSGIDFTTGSVYMTTSADSTGAAENNLSAYYTVHETGNGFTLTLDVAAMRADGNTATQLYTYYEGVVTEDAVTSTDKENNTVTLTYSNNPYDTTSKGTASDTVYSYTFALDITKTANNSTTPLAGAEFALYLNSAEAGNQIGLAAYLDGNGAQIYTAAGAPIYYTTTGTGTITTGENGLFHIKGLDDATTYVLSEVKAPEGYNAIQPITFVVTAEYAGTELSNLTVDSSSISAATGGLSATIINRSESILPETGGIGTVIFIVVGGVLMAGALGTLVMSSKKKS